MNNLLLPYKFKWIGTVLVLIGFSGLAFYAFFDFRLDLPVFAVYSSFFETRMFAIIQTNVADELIMLTLLTGFVFLAFSKEKAESEILDKMRVKAFAKAMLTNAVLLAFSILFVFGNGFVMVLLINIFSVFIFYLVYFFLLKRTTAN